MLWRVTHENARALLARYAVGALDLATAAEVRQHIAGGCGECFHELFATRRAVRPHGSRAVDRIVRAAVVAAVIVVAAVASVWTIAGGRGTAPPAMPPRLAAPCTAGRADAVATAVPRAASPADVAPSHEEKPLISVRYSRNLLSVRLENAPLADVLHEIGRQSGVTVHARARDTRKVSVAFDDVPFEDALRRLLGHNFLLTYDGTRPHTLEVLETPRTASRGVALPKNQPPPPATAPPAEAIAAMLDERPALALSDTLAAAVGIPTMSLRRLLETGISHADPAVRSRAMRELVEALQADPDLRAAMFGARPRMDGGIFGALVEGMDTARAEEMLFYVAIAARDDQVQNDAATMIRHVALYGTRRDG